MGNRRAGPGPDWRLRPRPRKLPDPDFLLLLMISSRDMSNALDMFTLNRMKIRLKKTKTDIKKERNWKRLNNVIREIEETRKRGAKV